MIAPGPGVRVYLATQPCDMRKGMDGLAAQVQNVLAADPFSGALFVFRGKRGDILKILAWDGSGLCLFRQAARAGQVHLAAVPTIEGGPSVLLLEAAGRCPPEDCGGPSGYERLLLVLADPEDEEHDETLTWCGGPFDPTRADVRAREADIDRLARRSAPRPRASAKTRT